jgi:hypothetical protein
MLGGLIFLVLLLATLTWRVRAPALGWREAGLYAALTWGAVIALLTESLSVFHALRFWPVLIAWTGLLGALGLYLWWIWPQRKIMGRPVLGTPLVRVLAVAVVALWLLAGVAAGLAPPNTPDVLSYHLPRQLLWLEQGGVQHFATGSDRLLMMSPLAEMIQVHALVLAGERSPMARLWVGHDGDESPRAGFGGRAWRAMVGGLRVCDVADGVSRSEQCEERPARRGMARDFHVVGPATGGGGEADDGGLVGARHGARA